jgi:YbbR domain-containing protein
MKNRRYHIVLATTLVAFFLWLSVGLSDRYQVQVSAPLVIQSLPPGKALAMTLPRSVKLTFNDLGWRLAKLLWKPDVQWVVDLNTASENQILTVRDFAEQIGMRLGVQPISVTPESLRFVLDTMISKRVPIVPRYAVTFREGYGSAGNDIMSPESVTVTGAQSLLRTVSTWQTVERRFDETRQPIDVTVPLIDTTNAFSLTPRHVNLRINVEQFAERTFTELPIEYLSVPTNREVILSSRTMEVVVRGGLEQLSRINKSSFRVVVDYRNVLADTSGIIQPQVELPAGLRIVRRTPERFTYVVRKKF